MHIDTYNHIAFITIMNIIIILFFIFYSFNKIWIKQIIAVSISAINVTYIYFLMTKYNSNASIEVFGVELAYQYYALFILSLFVLYHNRHISQKIVGILLFLLIGNFLLIKPANGIALLLDSNTSILATVAVLAFIIGPFVMCTYVPLALMDNRNESLWKLYFGFGHLGTGRSIMRVFIVIALFIFLHLLFFLLYYGIVDITILTPFELLLKYSIGQILYIIFPDIIVLWIIPIYLINNVFKCNIKTIPFIIAMGVIFGLPRLFIGNIELFLWYAAFGIIYAYIYKLTGTLLYIFMLYSATVLLFS